MAQAKPERMQMNGMHQNGNGAGAVGAQHIGINLISRQGCMGKIQMKLFFTLQDSLGEGLAGISDTGNAPGLAEHLHPLLMAVGDDAQTNSRASHLFEPRFHSRRGYIGGIGHNGIIEIQHQKVNASLPQPLGRQIREGMHKNLGNQRKGQRLLGRVSILT